MNTLVAIMLIIVLFMLLLFSAFFSASETAFTSLSQVRIKNLSQTKKSAKLVMRMSENYNKLLSTLLIGNNIVNITSASLATILFTFWFGDLGVTLSTIVIDRISFDFRRNHAQKHSQRTPRRICYVFGKNLICLPDYIYALKLNI